MDLETILYTEIINHIYRKKAVHGASWSSIPSAFGQYFPHPGCRRHFPEPATQHHLQYFTCCTCCILVVNNTFERRPTQSDIHFTKLTVSKRFLYLNLSL